MEAEILKKSGLKSTRQRVRMLELLSEAAVPLTAEELYHTVSGETQVNLSTVYRTLGLLTEKGVLLKTPGQDGRAYYQLNNGAHRHHLICSACHEVVLIDSCPLEELGHRLSETTGYTIIGHSFEFVGICPDCARHTSTVKHQA